MLWSKPIVFPPYVVKFNNSLVPSRNIDPFILFVALTCLSQTVLKITDNENTNRDCRLVAFYLLSVVTNFKIMIEFLLNLECLCWFRISDNI